MEFVPTRKATKTLGIHPHTIRALAKEGKIENYTSERG